MVPRHVAEQGLGIVFLKVSNGRVTGKPSFPVCREGLGHVQVGADDEGKRLE